MINLLEQLTELRETLMLSSLIRDIIKDTDEQPDEDIHRVRSGRVPRAGASVPTKLGCTTLLARGRVHQPRSSLNARPSGCYGASSRRQEGSLAPSPEDGGGAEVASFSPWLGPSGAQPPS